MKKFTFLFAIGTAFLLSSCGFIDRIRVKGNGNIGSKVYDYKDFTSLDISNNMSVFLQQSPNYSVKVETDDNIIPYIRIRKAGEGELEIDTKDNSNLNPSDAINIYISAPAIDKIIVTGVSQIETQGKFAQDKKIFIELSGASTGNVSLRAPEVEIKATGASTLTADGECRDIKANATGASTINAFELKSENCQADASGASTTRIFSSISLKADASGASTVKYKGKPNVVSKTTGASSVSKEN